MGFHFWNVTWVFWWLPPRLTRMSDIKRAAREPCLENSRAKWTLICHFFRPLYPIFFSSIIPNLWSARQQPISSVSISVFIQYEFNTVMLRCISIVIVKWYYESHRWSCMCLLLLAPLYSSVRLITAGGVTAWMCWTQGKTEWDMNKIADTLQK